MYRNEEILLQNTLSHPGILIKVSVLPFDKSNTLFERKVAQCQKTYGDSLVSAIL